VCIVWLAAAVVAEILVSVLPETHCLPGFDDAEPTAEPAKITPSGAHDPSQTTLSATYMKILARTHWLLPLFWNIDRVAVADFVQPDVRHLPQVAASVRDADPRC
jgi:hypothetical protein